MNSKPSKLADKLLGAVCGFCQERHFEECPFLIQLQEQVNNQFASMSKQLNRYIYGDGRGTIVKK